MPRSPMLAGTCHCGAVRVALPRRPRSLTACNCSICRRYGALWAYYSAGTVRIEHARGATSEYLWGDRRIRFVRCGPCGCVTHWERARRTPAGRVGVNARLFEPGMLRDVRIRSLDGAKTWKYLDGSRRPHRRRLTAAGGRRAAAPRAPTAA